MKTTKYILIMTVALMGLTSCDSPSNNSKDTVIYRSHQGQGAQSDLFAVSNTTPSPTTNSQTGSNRTPASGSSAGSNNIPEDVDHCLWSEGGNSNFMHSSIHLSEGDNRSNSFTVCQSRKSDSVLYFQIDQPIKDVQLCFIPMNQQGQRSTYIGEPRCLNVNTPHQIYRIQMFKTRQGFESLPINGVMIIKDKMYAFGWPYNRHLLSPDAFLQCNQALTHPVYPNPRFCETFIYQKHYYFQRF